MTPRELLPCPFNGCKEPPHYFSRDTMPRVCCFDHTLSMSPEKWQDRRASAAGGGDVKILAAAENMDWGQVVCNGGPPCFYFGLDGAKFCGRAEGWAGHGAGHSHQFVSLAAALEAYRKGEGK